MLNTAIWRPLTSTSLRVPAGNSRSAAITCFAMRAALRYLLGEPAIRRERVVAADAAVQLLRNSGRHDIVAVELPMREIRSEQQHVVGLQMLDQFADGGRDGPAG